MSSTERLPSFLDATVFATSQLNEPRNVRSRIERRCKLLARCLVERVVCFDAKLLCCRSSEVMPKRQVSVQRTSIELRNYGTSLAERAFIVTTLKCLLILNFIMDDCF